MIEAGERAIASQKTESVKNGERHCRINDFPGFGCGVRLSA